VARALGRFWPGTHAELTVRLGVDYEMVVRQAASGGKDLDSLALRE
jgi:hypothetical protein